MGTGWILFAIAHICGMIVFVWALRCKFCVNCDDDDDDDFDDGVAEFYPDDSDSKVDSKVDFWTFCKKILLMLFGVVVVLLWEISTVIIIVVDLIESLLKFIANRKYERLFYDRLEPCDGSYAYEKGNDHRGDRAICQICGFVLETTTANFDLMEDHPDLMKEMQEKFPHKRKTATWLEFEKTFWYRMAMENDGE